jgi:hypothetical protein
MVRPERSLASEFQHIDVLAKQAAEVAIRMGI